MINFSTDFRKGGPSMKTAKPQEYAKAVKAASPPSPVVKDCIWAFLVGGFICTVGQILCNLYQNLGLELPHGPGLVRRPLQTRRCRYAGADYRVCQLYGVPGYGVQKRGLHHRPRLKAVHRLWPGAGLWCDLQCYLWAYNLSFSHNLKYFPEVRRRALAWPLLSGVVQDMLLESFYTHDL